MQRCIYCPNSFDEAPKEHVIHAFLGARWKDGTLICPNCQSTFGDGIDVTLAERLQPYRLLLGIEGDHGGTGQPLKNLPVTSGETVDIEAHGKPKIVRPQVTITEDGDRHQVQVKIGRTQDLGWALNEVRKQLPHAEFDQEQIKKLGVQKLERLDGEVKFDLTLGGLDFFRAVLKCCANLFAAHDPVGREAFLGPAFNGVRAFVLEGTGQMADFARWVISPAPLNLPIRGSADQMIILTTRGNSVEGVIRFFGQLSFAVRLATNYTNAPIRCAYIVDPYREADPAEQRLNGDSLTQYDDQIPIFVEQSPGNNADVQAAWDAALNRFMAHYSERENEATVQKVVDESIQLDSRIAAMDRKDAEEMVRKLIQKRFAEFERTGQTDKLTVLRTRTGDGIKPIEDVAN
jgi:hypothetical protein